MLTRAQKLVEMVFCRLCRRKKTALVVNIFSLNNQEILEEIRFQLNRKPSPGDSLPENICHICVHKLKSFQKYRKSCYRRYEHLENRDRSTEEVEEICDTLVPSTSRGRRARAIEQACTMSEVSSRGRRRKHLEAPFRFTTPTQTANGVSLTALERTRKIKLRLLSDSRNDSHIIAHSDTEATRTTRRARHKMFESSNSSVSGQTRTVLASDNTRKGAISNLYLQHHLQGSVFYLSPHARSRIQPVFLPCNLCPKKFTNVVMLREHVLQRHSAESLPRTIL